MNSKLGSNLDNKLDSNLNSKYIITKMPLTYEGRTYEDKFITATIKDDKLTDLHCLSFHENYAINDIFIGRVDSIATNIHAIFIKIAPDVICYLPYDEIKHAVFTKKSSNSNKEVAVGDELLVQLVREKIKAKQAAVTTKLSMKGQYCIISNDKPRRGISRKISSLRREQLSNLLQHHSQDYLGMDIILRTNCEHTADDLIMKEASEAAQLLDHIIKTAPMKTLYLRLYHDDAYYVSYLKGCYENEIAEVITDLPDVYTDLTTSCASLLQQKNISCRLYEDTYPLYQLYSLTSRIQDVLSKKVWLKSGAYLIIEPTEALTVIDVNSGKNEKKDNGEYFLKINMEAAKEVARQLRLRNISGICIIDFIDMKDTKQQQQLIEYVKQLCKKDRISTTFIEMTKLHLVELTRKKTDGTFVEQLQKDNRIY